MKILFLTPQVPFRPDKGTTIRNLNLIKRVARHHTVDLLTFTDSQEEVEGAASLGEFCQKVVVRPAPRRSKGVRARDTFSSGWPDMALRLYTPEFAVRLAEMLDGGDYDVLQVEGIELMRYALDLRLSPVRTNDRQRQNADVETLQCNVSTGEFRSPVRVPRRPAIVFDNHNAEYVLQRRAFETDCRQPRKWAGALYSLIQWQKLVRFERQVCRLADAVLAVSEIDREALRRLDPNLDVVVVPNGIDAGYFAGFEANYGASTSAAKQIVFVGTLDYRPNIDAVTWFVAEIFPLIQRAVQGVSLQIIGRRPAAAVRRLGAAQIQVRDDVADVRPELAKSHIYVVPMRIGGGVRFKVLEAMTCRIPVVTTAMGADGIPAPPNQYFVVADEPGTFAKAVIDILRQPEKTAAMTDAAQRFVLDNYEWEVILPKLEAVYRSFC